PQVAIDVLGADTANLAVLVHVLQELLAWDLLTSPDYAREARLADLQLRRLAALPSEAKAQSRRRDLHVTAEQRRQSIGSILARVLRVPDADLRSGEELDDGGEHLLARQPFPSQIALHATTDSRQRASKGGE